MIRTFFDELVWGPTTLETALCMFFQLYKIKNRTKGQDLHFIFEIMNKNLKFKANLRLNGGKKNVIAVCARKENKNTKRKVKRKKKC